MHLHQVLTGAVNPGDCCYSVGSANDIPFTVSVSTDPPEEQAAQTGSQEPVGAAS